MSQFAIVPGSVSAIAKQSGKSIAETFLSVEMVILIDVSGSMACHDSRGGKSSYEVALEELAKLQANNPGKLGIIAFSSNPVFCPGGQPDLMGGGTNLTGALDFAKVADTGDMRFVVISDGEPDDDTTALTRAQSYKGRIDTVYVGPEGGSGSEFMQLLAKRKGGMSLTAAKAQELAAATTLLLSR